MPLHQLTCISFLLALCYMQCHSCVHCVTCNEVCPDCCLLTTWICKLDFHYVNSVKWMLQKSLVESTIASQIEKHVSKFGHSVSHWVLDSNRGVTGRLLTGRRGLTGQKSLGGIANFQACSLAPPLSLWDMALSS